MKSALRGCDRIKNPDAYQMCFHSALRVALAQPGVWCFVVTVQTEIGADRYARTGRAFIKSLKASRDYSKLIEGLELGTRWNPSDKTMLQLRATRKPDWTEALEVVKKSRPKPPVV